MIEKSWSYKSDTNVCEIKEFLAEKFRKGHTFKQLDILDLSVGAYLLLFLFINTFAFTVSFRNLYLRPST